MSTFNNTNKTNNTRDYYKGTSMYYSFDWDSNSNYMNDDMTIDFVSLNGVLYACKKSHLSTFENMPGTDVGAEYWHFVMEGQPGANGQLYYPEYNDTTGFINWILKDNTGEEIEPSYVRGRSLEFEFNEDRTVLRVRVEGETEWVDSASLVGPQGVPGKDGADGKDGPVGPQGPEGPQGLIGPIGPEGPVGPQGPQGPIGPIGPTGGQGKTGETGAQGPEGKVATFAKDSEDVNLIYSYDNYNWKVLIPIADITGKDGKSVEIAVIDGYIQWRHYAEGDWIPIVSIASLQGEQGEIGPQGEDGRPVKLYASDDEDVIYWGYDGVPISNWHPLVSYDDIRGVGIVSAVINDEAHLIITLSDGTKIDAGRAYGEPGRAATVAVGSVTTVEYGESAEVTNVGSENDAIFNFKIPEGRSTKTPYEIAKENGYSKSEEEFNLRLANIESTTDKAQHFFILNETTYPSTQAVATYVNSEIVSALEGYINSIKSDTSWAIETTKVANEYKINLKLSTKEGNTLVNDGGLYSEGYKISSSVDADGNLVYKLIKHNGGEIDGSEDIKVPVDLFLEDVQYNEETKKLVFVFDTETGQKTIEVDMSSLVDTYKAGNGLSLDSGGTFSIKMKSGSTGAYVDSGGLFIDYRLINDLTSTDSTAALTAAQGKILNDMLTLMISKKIDLDLNVLLGNLSNTEGILAEFKKYIDAKLINPYVTPELTTNSVGESKVNPFYFEDHIDVSRNGHITMRIEKAVNNSFSGINIMSLNYNVSVINNIPTSFTATWVPITPFAVEVVKVIT